MGPYTIRHLQASYGRFLSFLDGQGLLDPNASPMGRVTRPTLDGYRQDLLAHGNSGTTIRGRFVDLEQILVRMHPGADVRWVSRPGGRPIHAYLDMTPRTREAPDAAVLLAHAKTLFEGGLAHSKPRCRRALVRDAALIVVLVTRAPRLRALAGLRLGVHLLRTERGWRLLRTPDLEKTEIEHLTSLPLEAALILDRYVKFERTEMLGGRISDAVWIAQDGGILAQDSISRRVRRHTEMAFGQAFGPHAYRKALVTFMAYHCPEDPLAGSVALGHASPRTTLARYNRTRAIVAGQRYAGLLAKLQG